MKYIFDIRGTNYHNSLVVIFWHNMRGILQQRFDLFKDQCKHVTVYLINSFNISIFPMLIFKLILSLRMYSKQWHQWFMSLAGHTRGCWLWFWVSCFICIAVLFSKTQTPQFISLTWVQKKLILYKLLTIYIHNDLYLGFFHQKNGVLLFFKFQVLLLIFVFLFFLFCYHFQPSLR